MSQHREEACRWLDHLRRGSDNYASFIGYVREEAQKGNFSLADIGTSEEELDQLRVKGCKTAAQKWLGYLRRGTDMYDDFTKCLRREVEKGNFSLADIGTSEEELDQLRVKGCKTAAQKWLDHLRRGSDNYDSYIGYVRGEAKKGNLSLADIGTSEEELSSFARVATT